MNVDINPGEIKIDATNLTGRCSLLSLGIADDQLQVEGGNLRLVFELGSMAGKHFFKMPTVEIAYHEHIGESAWVAEFNGENILEKTDHAGHATLLMLNRDKLALHRHENTLVIHGDLPSAVGLKADQTYFNLVEAVH